VAKDPGIIFCLNLDLLFVLQENLLFFGKSHCTCSGLGQRHHHEKIKMKRTAVLMFALCAVSYGAPEQKLRIRVTDESGAPLKDVACMGGWWKDVFAHGATDQDGIVELTGRTRRHETLAKATIEGYYSSEVYRFMMTGSNGNHWEPWPVEVNLVMKKIRNPHPMYAVKPGDNMKFTFPNADILAIAFDVMEGDWVAPHGKGKIADLVLSPRRNEEKASEQLPPGTMLLAFSNPNDGIIAIADAPAGGSDLASPTEAPISGYLKECVFSNRPLVDGLFPGLELSRRVWVFRVRSKVDDKGNIVNAYYGKIQGQPEILFFRQGPAFRMTYYLNGKENDRSLEWDMKTNLFNDLIQAHWPRKP
jgi:hypothetical protein